MAAARAAAREAAALAAAARRPLPVGDGDELEDPLPQPPQQRPAVAVGKLPDYWSHAPAAWFAFIEAKFRRARLNDEAAMFDEAAAALSEDAIMLSLDLLETPPAVEPYYSLKRRLLRMHQLTPLQKMAKLHALPPMGDRTPSQLLASMIELAPPGEEDNIFMKYLFLERLPDEIRILLGNEIGESIRDLAEIADGHAVSYRVRRQHTVAAVSDVPDFEDVNAVRGGGKHRGGKSGSSARGARGGAHGGGSSGGRDRLKDPPAGSTLCFFHHNFGQRARKCVQPCTWAEN